MKFLLTGVPKSGKSTLLASILTDVGPTCGLSSPEVRRHGERIGFDLRDAGGNTATLSRVGVPTDYPVGRYYVDLVSLERFIESLFKHTVDQLLFIDEIGQMQLYSERFQKLVKDYLKAPNDFVGTVSQVYDHPFINDLRQNKDNLLWTVTPANREELKAVLVEALNHRAMFNLLARDRQRKVLNLARGYLVNDQYISLKKLFGNAIPYIVNGKVHREGRDVIVQGNTNKHRVRVSRDKFACDCDFFNGRGQFMNKADECSHIQSAKLVSG